MHYLQSKAKRRLDPLVTLVTFFGHFGQTINKNSTLKFSIDYQPMADKVLAMLKMSLDALVMEDADLARRIFLEDDEVDRQRNQAYKAVVRELDIVGHGACLVNMYLLARHLERIGDRTTNIAEEVIYLVEGEIKNRGQTPIFLPCDEINRFSTGKIGVCPLFFCPLFF